MIKTVNGVDYVLEFDNLYYWAQKRGGHVAKGLQGRFIRKKDALEAFLIYDLSLIPTESEVTGKEELESLTGKKDMLKWAEENGISVPEDIKHPLSIKKFLLGAK